MLSSKNINYAIDLIDFIDTKLVKVIGFKLPDAFIMFYLIFLSLLLNIVIISIITKSLEYAILLFCLLIVQKALTILFIFDDS